MDIDLITLQLKLALRKPGCPLCRLRRATPPAPLRIPLRDPASNSADDIAPIVARLEAAIASELRTRETAPARALLPVWVEHRGYAEALIVTHQRLLRIPDPAAVSHLPHSLDLAEITSVEFSMSILESYLALHTVREGRPQVERIVFPHTGTGFKEMLHGTVAANGNYRGLVPWPRSGPCASDRASSPRWPTHAPTA